MKKRAEASAATRERILRATMSLHDEKGVATTTFSDVAERAGVGAATIYRNFPTLDALIAACGAHVWQDMRPPVPQEAAALFAGLKTRAARLERLVQELDAFYRRGEYRLVQAGHDRHRVPGLEMFLTAVEAGIEAWTREALAGAAETDIRIVLALCDLRVWASLKRLQLSKARLVAFMIGLIESALAAEGDGPAG